MRHIYQLLIWYGFQYRFLYTLYILISFVCLMGRSGRTEDGGENRAHRVMGELAGGKKRTSHLSRTYTTPFLISVIFFPFPQASDELRKGRV